MMLLSLSKMCQAIVSTMLTTATCLLLMVKPVRPLCSLLHHNSHRFSVTSTTSSISAMMSSDEISCSSTSVSQQQNRHVFQGHRTKIGKRLRKREDKATNNARVRNSYLKLSLGETAFNSLHQLIRTMKQQWDSSENERQQHLNTVSKKQSKRQLTIKPRTLPSLHMTYFFCGKVLDEMQCDELHLWNAMVRERLLEYNNTTSSADEYTLQFKGLQLFPPNKHYLVVAMFEPSSKLYRLYEEICKLALSEKSTHHQDSETGNESEYLFPLLAELTKSQHDKRKQNKSSAPSWVAHVTLGNLSGGNRDDVKRLNSWLEDYKYHQASDMMQQLNTINVKGLALGGPIPSHVDVDWEYSLHPKE